MKPTKPPDKDDVDLFREAVGPVRPLLRQNTQIHSNQKHPAPEPRQSRLDEARVSQELLTAPFDPATMEVGEELHYLKSGVAARIQRQLRRGQFSVQAEIDLHHMTATEAETSVKNFLDDCRRHGELCVRIIHGKGLHSKDGPVLKRLTEKMLRHRADVLAFASALAAQGGTGAVVVLLERHRD